MANNSVTASLKNRSWHARDASTSIKLLKTDLQNGLDSEEAQKDSIKIQKDRLAAAIWMI